MVEVAQSHEMVRNFNNFKDFVMFAMKKLYLKKLLFVIIICNVPIPYIFLSSLDDLSLLVHMIEDLESDHPHENPTNDDSERSQNNEDMSSECALEYLQYLCNERCPY
jgi:hypothetical protein